MTAIAYVETAFPNVHAGAASLHQGAGTGLYTTGPHCGHGTGLFTTGSQSGPQAGGMATGTLTGLFTTGC